MPVPILIGAALAEIALRYGTNSIRLVTMPIEYDTAQAKD